MQIIGGKIPETDLLVIGAGVAGCVAALKAVESGLGVVLWEKAGILRSGSASVGIRNIRNFLPPELSLEEISEGIFNGERFLGGEERLFRGIIDENITYAGYRDCWDTVQDLERWGIDLHWNTDEYRLSHGSRTCARTNLQFKGGAEFKKKLAQKVIGSPALVLERIMAVDLLTAQGSVSGCTGINIRTGEFVFAKAKAVLLSTGSTMRLYHSRVGAAPAGRFKMLYSHQPTPGDGIAMAFRGGAELVNMEIIYEGGGGGIISPNPYDSLCTRIGPLLGPATKAPIVNARGEKIGEGRVDVELILKEENAGRGPCFIDATSFPEEVHRKIEETKTDAQPISRHFNRERGFDTRTHKFEIMPYRGDRLECCLAGIKINEKSRASVRGLYAAGDTAGGTIYDGVGGAMIFGRKAGIEAGGYIENLKGQELDDNQLAASKDETLAPLRIKSGIAPLDLEMKIRDIVERYCGAYRSQGRIKQGLWRLNSVKDNFLPQLQAKNPHQLMTAQEVKNLLLLAEIHMNCALHRLESRPGNWRLDYPEKMEAAWKSSIIAKRDKGGIKLSRRVMPSLKVKAVSRRLRPQ